MTKSKAYNKRVFQTAAMVFLDLIFHNNYQSININPTSINLIYFEKAFGSVIRERISKLNGVPDCNKKHLQN